MHMMHTFFCESACTFFCFLHMHGGRVRASLGFSLLPEVIVEFNKLEEAEL